jgi:3'-phosphoadenosine 5'-phosphosulfate (PAPS) 3'-phosphatase
MQQAKAILADATLLKALQLLIHQAGEAIMQVYQPADFGVETKKDNPPPWPRQAWMHTMYW